MSGNRTTELCEKLRKWVDCKHDMVAGHGFSWLYELTSKEKSELLKIADEIEAEIDSRYMLLPVDADGVPIHVGDVMKLKQCGERIGTVTAVGEHEEVRAWILPDGKNVSISYIASGIKHVKPRTIEDILADMLDAYDKGEDGDMPYSFIADYADELHELMEVGK